MPTRLGDTVEDHCSRCTRLTDHSVVAIMNDEIVKVRCRTCNHDHKYRYGKGARKKDMDKKTAFDQVLASIVAEQPGGDAPEAPEKSTPGRRKSGRKKAS